VVNRGAAIYGDKVFFGTLDAGIVALNKDTGKVVWKKKWGDHKVGYTMTGAPFVIQDQKSGKVLLVHGSSGDEFGVVGWLFARDPETGEEVWARPMVEGHMGRLNGKDSTYTGDPKAPSWPEGPDGKKVEAWSHGGGAPWQTASFDVEKNMVVIGTGNPAPWNTWKRTKEGDDPRNWDSLFTSGQAYVDASTGELKGFFQHTPNDAWDFLRQQLGGAVRVQGSEDRQAGQGLSPRRPQRLLLRDRPGKAGHRRRLPQQAHLADRRLPVCGRHHLGQGLRSEDRQADHRRRPAPAQGQGRRRQGREHLRLPALPGRHQLDAHVVTARTPACSTSPPTTGPWTTGPRS
jgi:hypothetical protein